MTLIVLNGLLNSKTNQNPIYGFVHSPILKRDLLLKEKTKGANYFVLDGSPFLQGGKIILTELLP